MPASYVKAYVKRNKNDAADAPMHTSHGILRNAVRADDRPALHLGHEFVALNEDATRGCRVGIAGETETLHFAFAHRMIPPSAMENGA
jgi:hypothetical protein